MGEGKACIPTVFRLAWPEDIKEIFHKGGITNSDLEMAGFIMLWLVMEEVCPKLWPAYIALFSDNSPTIGWAKRLAARVSLVAMQLVRALTLWLKKAGASPLIPLHISGEGTFMTDIPSRLFGSNLAWFCKNDTDLLNLFNKIPLCQISPLGPSSALPTQRVWWLFQCYGCRISKWASGFNSKRQENV